jgi:S-adenosylmethionine synthetase
MARYVAKNVVASGIMDKCEVRVAYAIGMAHPVAVNVDDRGTARVDLNKLEKLLPEFFDFRPGAIIDRLQLRRPIYKATSSYGHFGRTDKEHFTWEKTDAAEDLAKVAADL